MPGPLPNPDARRRNQPTIPTTKLPIEGLRNAKGARIPAPKVPAPYKLGAAGVAWWKWAWATPQAAGWSPGDLYTLARRARLEDDVAELRKPPKLNLEPLIEMIAEAAASGDANLDLLKSLAEHVRYVLGVFKSLAGQKSVIEREMRELDDRFGLTPKGMAQLRWKIVATKSDEPAAAAPMPPTTSKARATLRAV